MDLDYEIITLLKELCPDYSTYYFSKNDIAKGKLLGKHNVYWKKGNNSINGLVTGKKNEEYFHMNSFKKNFESFNLKGEKEEGWSGKTLFDLLISIKNNFTN